MPNTILPLSGYLARFKIFLIIMVIGQIAYGAAEYDAVARLLREPNASTDTAWTLLSNASGLAAVTFIAAAIAAYVQAGFWIVRAMANLHRLGSKHVTMKPGWAVGWYFVPIACIWKPYQGMNQIWKGSFRTKGEMMSPDASPLPLWWGLWLLMNFIDNDPLPRGGLSMDIGGHALSSLLNTAMLAVDVFLAIQFYRILRTVTDLQSRIGQEEDLE